MRIPALVVKGALIVLLASCGETDSSANNTPKSEARKVRTQKLQPDVTRDTTRVTGFLRSPTDITISAETSGRVTLRPFNEGAQVKKGDVIVMLDTSTLEIQVAQARAAVEEALLNPDQPAALRRSQQAALQVALDQLARCTIRSMVDGVLNRVWPDVGEWVTVGTPVAQVVGLKQLEFVASLSELESVQVQIGEETMVRVDAHPNRTFPAHVGRVSRAADITTHRFEVTLKLNNRDEALWVGMFASARLSLGSSGHERLVVPKTACQERFDEMFCFVAGTDGVAMRRRIEVAEIPGRTTLFSVTKGLEFGEVIVLGPLTGLDDGSPIQVAK